jgi:MFS family permease
MALAATLAVMPMLMVLLTGQALASMDVSILIVAGPTLRADLHTSGPELQLVLAMYTLAFGALVVTGARLGDVLGPRRVFLLGLAGFTLSSLGGGLAPTVRVLIAARAFQGGMAALMTPQVLSIIQLRFDGERRARAIGAYSMILAAGVAAGQVLGGLLVETHLLAAAWRPALLLNAPVGAVLLPAARRALPRIPPLRPRRLDPGGAMILALGLLALVIPLTLGRDTGWQAWVWPCFIASGLGLTLFVRFERRIAASSGDPLFDLSVLARPGVAPGVVAITLVMACYAGFLVSLTLHLQNGLRFSPLHAGLTFFVYAAGFGTASRTWTRARPRLVDALPIVGPLTMGVALLIVGLIAAGGSWPPSLTAPLLFASGVGHALSFSPLASRLTMAVRPDQAADLSGLIMTASLVGQVIGVAALVRVFMWAVPDGSGPALAITTGVLAALLLITALSARRAVAPRSHTKSQDLSVR